MEVRTHDVHDVLTALARIVKERRDQLAYSQEELAIRSGLHRTYISDIERGARNISVRNLIRLASSLQMKPSELLSQAEQGQWTTDSPESA